MKVHIILTGAILKPFIKIMKNQFRLINMIFMLSLYVISYGVQAATLLNINSDTFQNVTKYVSFWNDFVQKYKNNPSDDFIVYNNSTHEAYYYDNSLYLKGIGYHGNASSDKADYNFISLGHLESYKQLSGQNNIIQINAHNMIGSTNFLQNNNTQLNVGNITNNLRELIFLTAEAVRFRVVAQGAYSGKVSQPWISYEPILSNWQKTLEYNNKTKGTQLNIEDTLEYLNSLQNKQDYTSVKSKIACPLYGGNNCE